jgi:rfaE bifunctional protein nucleotidyltransferase chain/domain/rfaE bifunctional protein kinase chain/domain
VRRDAVVVVGDTLLDRDIIGSVARVCPDAPAPVVDVTAEVARPGGSGLAALLAARTGAPVVLVTALAADGAGDLLRAMFADAGVELVDLGLRGATPEKIRVRSGASSLVRIDRACDHSAVENELPETVAARLDEAGAILVADYGRGLPALPRLRTLLAARAHAVPIVWDPHPRGAPPVAGVQLATPNQAELPPRERQPSGAGGLADLTARARDYAGAIRAHAVAVTMGARGAIFVRAHGAPLMVPAAAVAATDTCGAGDCFAATATVQLARGAVSSEAVEAAVGAASAFVAAGAASAADVTARPGQPRPTDGTALVAGVRARGGTVVATGGCFDLLHAGHVATLRAARHLGDALIVLVNSDESVRRLKGPDRPMQPIADRVAVLCALECVDAIEVFDEDTPIAALERLRPDVFAKGGDYSIGDLPEAAALARWGGQVVTLPYLAGRSTTRLVQEAARRDR